MGMGMCTSMGMGMSMGMSMGMGMRMCTRYVNSMSRQRRHVQQLALGEHHLHVRACAYACACEYVLSYA